MTVESHWVKIWSFYLVFFFCLCSLSTNRMPNGCTWKVNLKFFLIQFPNKNVKRFKKKRTLNLPIRFCKTRQHTDWFPCSPYFTDTFKAKTDNFSIWVSLITYILKARCTSESYTYFNMRSTSKPASQGVWCGIIGAAPAQCPPQSRSHYSSWLCPVGFCISPKVEIPQHFWATCSTLIVNLFFFTWSWNFLYSHYTYSCNSLTQIILSSALWWNGIALWHLTSAENPVCLFEFSVLILYILYVCFS